MGPYDPDNYCRGPFIDPKFPEESWQGISADAIYFVRLLLRLSPMTRPSAGEALQHEWLNSTPPTTPFVKCTAETASNFQGTTSPTPEFVKVPCKDRPMNSYSLSTVHPV